MSQKNNAISAEAKRLIRDKLPASFQDGSQKSDPSWKDAEEAFARADASDRPWIAPTWLASEAVRNGGELLEPPGEPAASGGEAPSSPLLARRSGTSSHVFSPHTHLHLPHNRSM